MSIEERDANKERIEREKEEEELKTLIKTVAEKALKNLVKFKLSKNLVKLDCQYRDYVIICNRAKILQLKQLDDEKKEFAIYIQTMYVKPLARKLAKALIAKYKSTKVQINIENTSFWRYDNSCDLDGGCWIATATYGSPLAKELTTFRHFRDISLKTNMVGRKLIEAYYRTSPPIANFIRRHETLKQTCRSVLDIIYNILIRRRQGNET